ncbi:hypothetical protein LR48_Vigan11g037200 [Vigna angularis]|uniref:Auxin-induced protein n=2 Tax=Phaseolus angularis TaxID=3914 RepID=A0A0L9VRF2_PHAAN|nr:hypothetical protein LR48_Vigan11g037200 [Vigna angularis]BAT97896.1 hypothetical protein VIGAN_09147800 [Vigna angularis var. angularis]
MNKLNLLLSKCKSFSRRLGRSSSYNSLRSKFVKEDSWKVHDMQEDEHCETVLVGSTRKQYVISSKYLNNPLLKALINKSNQEGNDKSILIINCEVVLFDHLLWMLENEDPMFGSDSLEELADLYVF